MDGRSLMIHTAKAASADSPTLESYFFPKVSAIIEKALKEGNKGNWPLITLYLDIKNDPEEHLQAIDKVLDKYDGWLTKAVKTADIAKMSPLELKPMMVILEDKQNDIKQAFFYDRIPVGGKFRAFGSAVKFDDNPNKLPNTARAERYGWPAEVQPEQLLTRRADNYHRWFGTDWDFIELCGPTHGSDWNAATEARLKKFVDYGHSLGYLVSFYEVNGFTDRTKPGLDRRVQFRFAAKRRRLRWNALSQPTPISSPPISTRMSLRPSGRSVDLCVISDRSPARSPNSKEATICSGPYFSLLRLGRRVPGSGGPGCGNRHHYGSIACGDGFGSRRGRLPRDGLRRETESSSSGAYEVAGLPIGECYVEVSASGFNTIQTKPFVLEVGETRSLNVSLDVGAVSSSVNVQAVVDPMTLSNAAVDSLTSSQRLNDLPVNGRNWMSFMALGPEPWMGPMAPTPRCVSLAPPATMRITGWTEWTPPASATRTCGSTAACSCRRTPSRSFGSTAPCSPPSLEVPLSDRSRW